MGELIGNLYVLKPVNKSLAAIEDYCNLSLIDWR